MHRFSKVPVDSISLIAGIGVLGDAHAGRLVQRLSRVRRDPNQPNFRQVHLPQAELFSEARQEGYELSPGDLGENILTSDIDLLSLPTGCILEVGNAQIRLTGVRNPCVQINQFRAGLLKVVLAKEDGTPVAEPTPSTGSPEIPRIRLIRKAGVMAVVERSGNVRPGDPVSIALPPEPHAPLGPV